MKRQKLLACILCVIMLVCLVTVMPYSVFAAGPTITTTLKDNIIQKSSKKTFDVWAKNSSGAKIKATVTLNGQKVSPIWDDDEKTSYTLTFSKEGENIVAVSASSDGGIKKQVTYHINYKKAGKGEAIGKAVWSVETFTVGCGYLVYPVEVNIYEGETCAEQLVRLLQNSGYVCYYSGTTKASFYLGYVANGTSNKTTYNNYKKSGTPSVPKKLNITPVIPSVLVPHLKSTMTFYDPNDYKKSYDGYLGEFAITNGSGWMYSVNNIFPNVGFADTYLSDGDVVRVQYTLGYGADIGGFGSMNVTIPSADTKPASGYFSVANKDELTKTIQKALNSGLITRANVKKAYTSAVSVVETLNASQNQVNSVTQTLKSSLSNPGAETNTPPTDTPVSVGVGSVSSDNSKTEEKNNSENTTSSNISESSLDESLNSSLSSQIIDEINSSEDKTQNEEKAKKSYLWIWIVCGVAVLLMVGAVCFLLYYKKKVKTQKLKEEGTVIDKK